MVQSEFDSTAYAATLMGLPQFAGADDFNASVEWSVSNPDVVVIRSPPGEPKEEARCIFVGRVSHEKAYLEPHGNFNARFPDPDKAARNAKYQFSLESPTDDPVMAGLYDRCYANAETLEGQVAHTTSIQHFLSRDSKRTMRFNFPLWEPKTSENSTPMRNAITSAYTVNGDGMPFWNRIKAEGNYQIRRPIVYDAKENLFTSMDKLPVVLPGSLAELLVIVKHYFIQGNASRPPSDTFVATIESISILRPAPAILRSPLQISPRKPRHVPQTPSRMNRVSADIAGSIPQPSFALTHSGASSVMGVSVPADKTSTFASTPSTLLPKPHARKAGEEENAAVTEAGTKPLADAPTTGAATANPGTKKSALGESNGRKQNVSSKKRSREDSEATLDSDADADASISQDKGKQRQVEQEEDPEEEDVEDEGDDAEEGEVEEGEVDERSTKKQRHT